MEISIVDNLKPKEKLGKVDLKNEDSFTTTKTFEVGGTTPKGSVEHCLLTWFNLAYYSCICPFRIRNVNGVLGEKTYILHRNLFQQIICGIIQTLNILIVGYEMVEICSKLSAYSKNPFDYLKVTLAVLRLNAHATVSGHLWIKSKCYLSIIETLSSTNIVVNIWLTRFMCLVCFWSVAASSVYNLVTVKACTPVFIINPDEFKCFLLGSETDDSFLYKLVEYSAYSFDLWRDYAIRVVDNSFDGLMLMICLTAYHVGVKFQKTLGKFPRERNVLNILNEYEKNKIYFAFINDAAHLIALMYVAGGVLFYAIHLKSSIGSLNVESLVNIYFFITYLIVIYLAAEASKKMDMIKLWLGHPEVCNSLPEPHLARLRYEVQVNPLGLMGYGIFVINYSFAATISGSLITYFIITVQFDNK